MKNLSFRLTPRSLLLAVLSLAPLLLCTPAAVHAQWEPDVRLTNDGSSSWTTGNDAWCIAASRDTVHVVWRDLRDGNYEFYYKRSPDGGASWSADAALTNDGSYSGEMSVAVSGTAVHVVWQDDRDGNLEIYYKRSTDGGTTWGPDVRLTNALYESFFPSMAVLGGAVPVNTVHVVWDDRRDGNPEIYYKGSSDGGVSWGADTRLTLDPNTSWYPSVAVSGTDVHVVWQDYRDGNMEIYTKHSSDGGMSWGSDTRLTYNPSDSQRPSVAVSDSNVHVVWRESRDGNMEIYTKRSTDRGASWGADTRLTNNSSVSETPSVAFSGSNVHLVWWDERDGNAEIYYKRSWDNGVSWGADTRLTNASGHSQRPSVAVSGTGVHVAWHDYRDGNDEIYYKRNPTGNGVEADVVPSSVSTFPFSVHPNPFTSFSTVPGHSSESFSLYDISGRRVGSYRGDRIGEGLEAGVYFVREESGKDKPVRVVKVR